jgi:hypothetical protein
MTKVNTPPSLRTQIIDAMNAYRMDVVGTPDNVSIAEDVFDKAIMPVLQQAMDAGQLLVGRNTKEREPVHQSIIDWLKKTLGHIRMLEIEDATLSRRQAFEIIYQIGLHAERALADAEANNGKLQ